MSKPIFVVRFEARIQTLHVDTAPNWQGVQNGFRSSVVLGEDHHPSQVMQCDGTMSPGNTGLVVLEMLTPHPTELSAGVAFDLRSGATIGARGVVQSIASTRPLDA